MPAGQKPQSPAIDALIKQRSMVNQTMGQLAPPNAPQAPPPNTAPFVFNKPEGIPDIQGLIRAMQGSGLTGSRTEDIELMEPTESLIRRANAIR